MAFKMKGAPQHDLSSKHGTNANFKKSGPPLMKGLGKMAGNFIKGKGAMGFMNPIGAIANKMGAFDGNNNNQQAQPTQQAPNPNPPAQPVGPAPTAPTMAEEAAPTMMRKKSSMTMKKKDGAPMVKAVKPKGQVPQTHPPMPKTPKTPKKAMTKTVRKNFTERPKVSRSKNPKPKLKPITPMLMKDLSGDGKITQKDVLIGRGVIKKDSPTKLMRKKTPGGATLVKIGGKSRRKKGKALRDQYVKDATARENARKLAAKKKSQEETTSRLGDGLKKSGATMKKSPMEKNDPTCPTKGFKVNKPGTVVSRALKRAGGSVKRGLDNVVDNIQRGNKKRKKKRNTVKAPKNTGRGGHIVRSSTSYN